jgi:zinc transport system substrate-binding protein
VTADLPSSTSLIATDPHIWLSPRLLRLQAQAIAAALSDADPSNQESYNKNLQHLLKDLDSLHERITDRLAPWRGRVFYVYHPAFGCFADDYGLTQKAVEIEGKDPTARQLSQLVEEARAERIRILFTEVQFNPRSAGILAEAIGAQVRRLNPLARDVLKNLDSIATELAESFQEKAP